MTHPKKLNCQCNVLGKHFTLTASVSTQECKWVPANFPGNLTKCWRKKSKGFEMVVPYLYFDCPFFSFQLSFTHFELHKLMNSVSFKNLLTLAKFRLNKKRERFAETTNVPPPLPRPTKKARKNCASASPETGPMLSKMAD